VATLLFGIPHDRHPSPQDRPRAVLRRQRPAVAFFYRNAFGFDVVAYAGLETKVKHEAGYVLKQGGITFVLVSPLRPSTRTCSGLSLHGDGVDGHRPAGGRRATAYNLAVERGATG
jgi:4-hydroxyphenylpyruvate dioxygenase